MREIKFRFRLKLISDDWGSYKEGDIGVFYVSLTDKANGLYRFPFDERWDLLTCDEFTGRLDKNKVEVFEGDKNEDGYTCIYSKSYASWIWINDNGTFYYLHETHKEKVIGNIHQNPELI
ncbi:MAG: hypothetical protein ACI9N9_000068 [Enterobacterales bacterium]|jgi:hypothetical protein